jgi:hypothetical protein
MTDTIIHIDGETAAGVLDEHGWTQGSYGRAGAVCLHGAIRLCQPHPGDAYLIEQVEARLGRWSTSWNDANGRTQGEVRAVLAAGLDYTDQDLADTFGPQWRAVVALVRRAAVLTPNEVVRLLAARAAAMDAAWAVVAWEAARGAAREAAREAARGAARDAARGAARDAAWGAATARDAAWAVVTWDLATDDGPYTVAHRDLLIGPWVEVCGLPDGLIEREDMER